MFVSEDAGRTWDRLPFDLYSGLIMGIAVKHGNPDTILVLTDGVDSYRSTDGGYEWVHTHRLTREKGGFAMGRQFASDPLNPDLVVVVPHDSLFVSTDFGTTWLNRTPPSLQWWSPVTVVHPIGSITRIVAPSGGTDGILYVSDDLGLTWAAFDTGVPDRIGVVAASGDGVYYANTDTSGVIKGRIDLPAVTTLYRGANNTLLINGTGFGDRQGTGTIKLNRTTVTVSSWNDSSITCQLPNLTGTVSLTVTNDARYRAVVEDVLSRITAAPLPVPGVITTVAGNGQSYDDGGPATQASLGGTRGIALDAQGALYISVFARDVVRRVSPDGIITTIAGTGVAGYAGDGGPATQAKLSSPHGVAVDQLGNVYFADHVGNRVRRVSPDGTITTFAGTGIAGRAGAPGPATQAQLDGPTGVAVDATGNVYICDIGRVSKVDLTGMLSALVVNAGPHFGPGNALALRLGGDLGDLYVSDTGGNRVLRLGPDGALTTVAGTGQAGSGGDGGPATEAQLNGPIGIAVDSAGNLYIAEWNGYRVRRVGIDGMISTFAGTGEAGYSEDGGVATEARLSAYGLAVGPRGELYIDEGNGRIRKVTPSGAESVPVLSPTIRLSTGSLTFVSTQSGTTAQQTLTVTNTGTASLVVSGITVTGAGSSQFTVTATAF
ncbi:MAG: IPT/TIG domain-containing protein, partial [Candidatus Latescibacterota bacterium]